MTEVKTFRLEKQVASELKKVAKRIDRKPNWIVNVALSKYLAELESNDILAEAKRQAQLLKGEQDDWENHFEMP